MMMLYFCMKILILIIISREPSPVNSYVQKELQEPEKKDAQAERTRRSVNVIVRWRADIRCAGRRRCFRQPKAASSHQNGSVRRVENRKAAALVFASCASFRRRRIPNGMFSGVLTVSKEYFAKPS